MFDWFKPSEVPTGNYGDAMKTVPRCTLSEIVVTATTEGKVRIDFAGHFEFTVTANSRHEFLEKIQRAVQMADIADPANEPFNKALT